MELDMSGVLYKNTYQTVASLKGQTRFSEQQSASAIDQNHWIRTSALCLAQDATPPVSIVPEPTGPFQARSRTGNRLLDLCLLLPYIDYEQPPPTGFSTGTVRFGQLKQPDGIQLSRASLTIGKCPALERQPKASFVHKQHLKFQVELLESCYGMPKPCHDI
jgi:hypothetical protein